MYVLIALGNLIKCLAAPGIDFCHSRVGGNRVFEKFYSPTPACAGVTRVLCISILDLYQSQWIPTFVGMTALKLSILKPGVIPRLDRGTQVNRVVSGCEHLLYRHPGGFTATPLARGELSPRIFGDIPQIICHPGARPHPRKFHLRGARDHGIQVINL